MTICGSWRVGSRSGGLPTNKALLRIPVQQQARIAVGPKRKAPRSWTGRFSFIWVSG